MMGKDRSRGLTVAAGGRALLLGGASALVIGAFAPAMVKAADLDLIYGPTLDFDGVGADSSATSIAATGNVSLSQNAAGVLASIDQNQFTTETDTDEAQTSTVVATNSLQATAVGNLVDTLADTPSSAGSGGLGILTVMVNTPTSLVNSLITNSEFDSISNTATGVSRTVSENTLQAITRLNDILVEVNVADDASGVTSDTTAGRTLINADPTNTTDPTIQTDATIAVATSQLNAGIGTSPIVGSDARIADTLIEAEVTVDSTATQATVSGSFNVEDNALSAAFTGNRATNDVGSFAETDFTGSVAVANQQLNAYVVDIAGVETVLDDAVASIDNTNILADFGPGGGDAAVLDGSAIVATNSLAASATGNSATNTLAFEAGVNLTGTGDSSANAELDLFAEPSQTSGDLTLVSQQANYPFTARAVTSDTRIGVNYEDIDASGIIVGRYTPEGEAQQDGNTVASNATGNTVSNKINADALSIDATSALSNAQVVGRRAADVAGSGDVVAVTQDTSIGVDTTAFVGTSFNGSSVAIDGNAASSRAAGSEAVNALTLSADETLDAGDVYVDLRTLANLTSDVAPASIRIDGGAVLSNFQGSSNSITSATTDGTDIGQSGVFASYANGSASIDENAVSATAIGLNAFNQSDLSGNAVTGSAGINSVQLHAGQDNDVEGGVSASVTDTRIGDVTVSTAGVDDSTISIDGNAVDAAARGSIVTNDLMISAATSIEFDANDGSVAIDLATADDDGSGSNAQYFPSAVMSGGALLASTQITNQDVSANITELDIGSNLGQSAAPSGPITDSSVTVDGNAVTADAIGNLVASNSPGNHLMVDAGTSLSVEAGDGPGTVVGLSNIQDLAAREGDLGAAVSVEVQDVGIGTGVWGTLARTDPEQGDSSLSVSRNEITGSAMGNLATENRITVTGSSVDLAGETSSTMAVNALIGADALDDSQTMSPMNVDIDSDAAVVLTNVQRGSAAGVSTNVGTTGTRAADTDVRIAAWVQGDVTGSAMTVDENDISAIAYDNTGTNAIALGDENAVSIATNTSLMSQQISAGPVSAVLGQPGSEGTEATPSSPFGIDAVLDDLIISSGTGKIFEAIFTVDATGFTTEELNALTSAGFTLDSGSTYVLDGAAAETYLNSAFGLSYGDPEPTSSPIGSTADDIITGTIPGTLATDPTLAIPSIVAEMDGNVIDSAISVAGNETLAAARGNRVTNIQEIAANTITGNSGITIITVAPDAGATDGMTVTVNADYATQNLQTREGALTASAYAAVGVLSDINTIPDVTGSSLTVDGNAQEALAEGNVATNTLSLAGTTLGTAGARVTSDLSSLQAGAAGGSSVSELDVFAPIAVSESSVSMSGNRSRAETTLNSAANSVSQTATNINGPAAGVGSVVFDENDAGATYFDIGTLTASSGASLSNIQAGSGSPATATAELIVHNTDDLSEIDNSYDGLASSSVMADANRVDAIVTGNTATNSVALDGEASLNVAGALSNMQINEHDLTATSTLEVDLALTQVSSATVAGIRDSSVSVADNVNLARGTGSIARNSVSAESTDLNGPISPNGAGYAILAVDRDALDRDGTTGVTGTTGLTGFDGADVAALGSAVAVNQQFSLAPISVTANSQFTTTANSQGVSGSSILQENNVTFAEATGNLSGRAADGSRVTTVEMGGTNVAGAAVAVSFQEANDSVAATATTDLGVELVGGGLTSGTGATYGLVNSTVSLSGNQTGAYATMNDASTTVSVSGMAVAGAEINNYAASGVGTQSVSGSPVSFEGDAAVGDHLLMSSQMASGAVNASATLNALSVDGSTGLVQLEGDVISSSLALSGNVTEASGAANRAFNSLSVAADTTLGAAGAVSNLQTSSADVTSTALMQGGIVNAGELPTAAPSGGFPYGLGAAGMEASSAEVIGNATVARARGNTATNVLNASAGTGISTATNFTLGSAIVGAAYDTDSDAGGSQVTTSAGSYLSRADYAMLNVQENSGAVSASANGSFGGILNSGSVSASALNVSGNTTAADAVGNYGSNSMTVPAGVESSNQPLVTMVSAQYNTGAVSARVQGPNATFGEFSGYGALSGGLNASSAGVTGNAISARAVGNSVVNRISRD